MTFVTRTHNKKSSNFAQTSVVMPPMKRHLQRKLFQCCNGYTRGWWSRVTALTKKELKKLRKLFSVWFTRWTIFIHQARTSLNFRKKLSSLWIWGWQRRYLTVSRITLPINSSRSKRKPMERILRCKLTWSVLLAHRAPKHTLIKRFQFSSRFLASFASFLTLWSPKSSTEDSFRWLHKFYQ